METMLIILLAIVGPYPVAGIVFWAVLAFSFYAAVIVAAANRVIAGPPEREA